MYSKQQPGLRPTEKPLPSESVRLNKEVRVPIVIMTALKPWDGVQSFRVNKGRSEIPNPDKS